MFGRVDCACVPPRQYPLSLTQGDLDENMRTLAESGDALDPQTADILFCWTTDPGPSRTLQALELLRHASGSTMLCEKGHSPTKICARQHDQLQTPSLRVQAFAHLHVPFFRLSQHQQRLNQLQRRHDDIMADADHARRIAPKGVLMHDLFNGCDYLPADVDLAGMSAKELLVAHHGIYNNLSEREKAKLRVRAGELTQQKRFERLDEASAVMEQIRQCSRTATGDLPGRPNTIDASRYDDEVLHRFLMYYDQERAPVLGWELEQHRSGPVSPPDLDAQRAILAKVQKMSTDRKPFRPWWFSLIVGNRDAFQNCALAFAGNGVEELRWQYMYLPLHICQKPQQVRFLRAELFDVDVHSAAYERACRLSRNAPLFEAVGKLDSDNFGYPSPIATAVEDSATTVFVYKHCVLAAGFVCTRSKPVCIEELAMALIRPGRAAGAASDPTLATLARHDLIGMIRDEYSDGVVNH